MHARTMLVAMVAGSVAVIAGFRRPDPPPPPPPPPPLEEVPWLSRADQDQLFDGTRPGPLFAGLVFGAPVSPEARERIAAFARAHDGVEIDLEVVDRELVAIRVSVTFAGGFGYEGVDVLALRLARVTVHECCGCSPLWVDDWAIARDDGTYMRARIRVNVLSVRWEAQLSFEEMLARAASLVGAEVATVQRAVGDRWVHLGARMFRIEVPHAFRGSYYTNGIPMNRHSNQGLYAVVDRGRISEVSFPMRDRTAEEDRRLRQWRRQAPHQRIVGRDEITLVAR